MSGSDKFSNKLDETKGRAKETVGSATGDEDLKAEGRGDQVKGQVAQAGEKLKDAASTVTGVGKH